MATTPYETQAIYNLQRYLRQLSRFDPDTGIPVGGGENFSARFGAALCALAAEDAREDRRALATISIIASNNQISDRINGLLSEYGGMIVGRMGMPYREMGVFLITVTLDGSKQAIRELGQRLSVLPDVSVKTTFAKL